MNLRINLVLKLELRKKTAWKILDAVFAIAITLLGLEFIVPTFTHSNMVFFNYLVHSWPNFVGYFLAFYILGMFLINHHRQFINIEYANEKLKLINFVFLAFIVLIPLSTSILTEYGDIIGGVLFFDNVVLISGLILYLNWSYVKKHKYLLKKEITSRTTSIITYRTLSIPIASIIAIGRFFYTHVK